MSFFARPGFSRRWAGGTFTPLEVSTATTPDTAVSGAPDGQFSPDFALAMIRLFRMGLLVPILFLGAPAGGAQELPTMSGTWTATIGQTRALRGKWVGQALPGEPNRAHGSWTLTGNSGKTVMSGSWAARKTSNGWEGTWSAQDRGGRFARGNWRADLPSNLKGTLQSMLEHCTKSEIAGTWRGGRKHGSWWLKGRSPAPLP